MEFIYSGPDRKREHIIGARFVPKVGGPVKILQQPIWDLTDDREPGESEENYIERKKFEQSNNYAQKVTNLYVGGIDGIDIG